MATPSEYVQAEGNSMQSLNGDWPRQSEYVYTEGNFISSLNEDWCKRAKDELFEDTCQRQSQIDTLREWVKQLPHVKSTRTDDQFLIKFLRTAKFNQKRAKEILGNFLSVYGSPTYGVPEEHKIRDPYNCVMEKIYKAGVFMALPGRDDEGRKVFMYRTEKWNPEDIPVCQIHNYCFLGIERYLMEEETQVSGVVFFIDFKGFSYAHASAMGREMLMKAAHSMQDAIPMRYKAGHHYNMSTVVVGILNLLKLFLKKKLKDRLYVYGGDLEAVKKAIPSRMLPCGEYGGEGGTIEEINDKYWQTITQPDAINEFKRMELIEIDDSKYLKEEAGWFDSYRKLNCD